MYEKNPPKVHIKCLDDNTEFSRNKFQLFIYTVQGDLLETRLAVLPHTKIKVTQILVGSTIEYGYYTDNQIFG